MSIISLLHNLLKVLLPSIHATRLQVLVTTVEAWLSGVSVSIDARAGLPEFAYIKHKIKRMGRLAGNCHNIAVHPCVRYAEGTSIHPRTVSNSNRRRYNTVLRRYAAP